MDLTVIICTWNRAKSLAVVLKSLAASVVPAGLEWEVLVVDNNSTDDTRAVGESSMANNPRRFRYLFPGTQGKPNALNAGIQDAHRSVTAVREHDLSVVTRDV